MLLGSTISEEIRQKMRDAAKKRFSNPDERKKISATKQNISLETRKKMSISAKNRSEALIEANKNRVFTPETRMKMSLAKKGKPLSDDHCKHLSDARKGKPFSESHKQALREANLGAKNPQFGKLASEETRKKLSDIRKLEKHPNWKGGISFEPYCVKFNKEFKERVRNFFGNMCVECNTPQNGTKFPVHHVNFNKMSCCDNTKPLFVTLCPSCHSKTNKNRPYWEQHFTEMINTYYEGQCYLPILPKGGV